MNSSLPQIIARVARFRDMAESILLSPIYSIVHLDLEAQDDPVRIR